MALTTRPGFSMEKVYAAIAQREAREAADRELWTPIQHPADDDGYRWPADGIPEDGEPWMGTNNTGDEL